MVLVGADVVQEEEPGAVDLLERLGWRFHRIWSTDWFNDREVETQRVLAAYEAALKDGSLRFAAEDPPLELPLSGVGPARSPWSGDVRFRLVDEVGTVPYRTARVIASPELQRESDSAYAQREWLADLARRAGLR
mgnify:CR=1 FL=1